MADRQPIVADDDEPLELTEELEPGVEPEEQQPGEENPDDEGEEQPSVSFEGEEPAPEENSVIREFRKREREKDKRIAELERQVEPKPVVVGPKPTLWDDDIAGDEDIYDKRLLAWKEQTDAAARQDETKAEQTRKANESWVAAKQRYDESVVNHGFADIKEDEARVEAALGINSPVILKAANDPAVMIRALGQNPAKLAELAKLDDPFEIAAAVARMEGAVKVTRKAPPPDRAQRGSAAMPVTGAADKELARLEKEAERTNDRTKVIAYKSEVKAKAAEAKK